MTAVMAAAAPRTVQAAISYTFTTIDVPGAPATYAFGINNTGQIVGYTLDSASGDIHSFLYSGGSFTTINVPGATVTQPIGINDVGQIVGSFADSANVYHGFIYSGGTFATIDAPGATGTYPYGINDAGQIVVISTVGFLDTGGSFTTIAAPGATVTLPYGINDAGQIVGDSTVGGFLDTGGNFTSIVMPGAAYTGPRDINNAGQVVGVSIDGSHLYHGFLYSSGSFTAVNVPGAFWTAPWGINDMGQIAGYFSDGTNAHGFLATPTGVAFASPKNLGGDCNCNTAQSAAAATVDPINAKTGNMFEVETDFVGAPNTQLELRRYYNSQDTTASAFGAGWHSTWHSTWHRGLSVAGNVATVTRADGQQDTFTKNGAGVYAADPDVTSVLTPVPPTGTQTGWKLTLDDDSVENYTLAGRLSSITTRAGLVTTLAYNPGNQLTTVTGPFGHTLKFAYDANGHVQQATIPDGGIYTYAYDSKTNLVSATYPDTKIRKYVYANTALPNALTAIIDENGNQFATFAYDSTGRATSSQHAGGADLNTVAYSANTSSTVTDARGNAHGYTLTTQFNLLKPKAVTGTPYPASGGKAFAYDANGFIASRTDFDGNVTSYVHNAKGEETSRTEASGMPLARTITTTWHATFHLPTKITEPNRTTAFTYDAKGNLLTKTVTAGAKVRTETWTYNANGQVLTAKDPDGHTTTYTYDAKGDVATIKDALGHVTKITSYDADGRPLSMADPNGLVTTLTYDKRGRLLTRAMGAEKTSYAYDAAGNLTKVTSPDGSSLTYSYDPAHRLTGIADKLGNHIAYTLDAAGNRTKTQVFDPGNALARTRSGVYNALNLLAQNLGAQGQTTAYAYDNNGNLTGVTDPLGHITANGYDALNRLVRTTDPNNGVTGYAYNANDRLTGVTDPRNLVTSYAYDGLDDQTRLTSPDAGATAKTYDAAGNVTGATDARGVTTTNTYDALNRLTKAASSDGTIVTYHYDEGGTGLGHLTSMVYPGGSTSWSYDVHGRVIRKQQSAGTTAVLTTSYSYDAAGRLAGMVYPSGRTLAYAYDASGRVSRISVGGQTLLSNVAYEPFGPVAGWTTGNGTIYERVYDADGAVSDVHWTTGSGGTRSVSLAYDAAQQITSLSDSALPLATFDYDALGRLTEFLRGTTSQNYTYDADGNRLDLATATTTTDYHYAGANNRLQSRSGASTTTYSYDAAGHLTGDGVRTYGYDGRGRLVTVTKGTATNQYVIDGLGQRVSKSGSQVAGGRNWFVYDEAGHLIGEYGASGAVITETVWLDGMPMGALKPGAVYYVYPDHLGAPWTVASQSGTTVWAWNRDPFGNGAPAGSFTYNLRFPGQYFDKETGLHYNYYRDYDPSTGRYVQSDPVGLAGGINTYAYVKGNPIRYFDVSGLQLAGQFSESEPGEPYTPSLFTGVPVRVLQRINQNYGDAAKVPNYIQEVTELAHDLNEIQEMAEEYNLTHPENTYNGDQILKQVEVGPVCYANPIKSGESLRESLLNTRPVRVYPDSQPILTNAR